MTISIDFLNHFPMPADNNLRRAGRIGLLDQKEDDTVSDHEWIAMVHRGWIEEFDGHHLTASALQYALAHGLKPRTGHSQRQASRWPQIRLELLDQLAQIERHLEGLLDDYGSYFGDQTAQAVRAVPPSAARFHIPCIS